MSYRRLVTLAGANAFVLRERWTGTFARGGRRTIRNALMRRYVRLHGPAHIPFKSAPSVGTRNPF